MQLLLTALGIREKAMVFLDMPTGLRRGELAGLKWEDFDFKRSPCKRDSVASRAASGPGKNGSIKKTDAD